MPAWARRSLRPSWSFGIGTRSATVSLNSAEKRRRNSESFGSSPLSHAGLGAQITEAKLVIRNRHKVCNGKPQFGREASPKFRELRQLALESCRLGRADH